MDPFVVDKAILGTSKHLLVNDGFAWIDHVPDRTWHLSGNVKNQSDWCFDTLLKLNCMNVNVRVPEKFEKAMSTLVSGSISSLPWANIMPKQAHRSFVDALVKSSIDSLNVAQTTFYRNTWVTGNHTFDKLQPASINEETFRTFIESGDGNVGALRTFEPTNGYAQPVVYDRFGSRTGRPTIESGPNILSLKREHRILLRSRWGIDGSIVLLDFSGLEVRIILYEAGHRCDNPDVYSDINNSLFAGAHDRDDVKGAVISCIYGQSKWALEKRLDVHGKHLDAFMKRIQSYFKVDQLLKTVKTQFIESGFILNRYGRRIVIDEPLDHVLINSYAQATGADVVTLGFNKIIERLSGARAVPIFFLVDAILFDVHNDDVDLIKSIDSIVVDGYVQKFPLKFEKVS